MGVHLLWVWGCIDDFDFDDGGLMDTSAISHVTTKSALAIQRSWLCPIDSHIDAIFMYVRLHLRATLMAEVARKIAWSLFPRIPIGNTFPFWFSDSSQPHRWWSIAHSSVYWYTLTVSSKVSIVSKPVQTWNNLFIGLARPLSSWHMKHLDLFVRPCPTRCDFPLLWQTSNISDMAVVMIA